MSNAGPSSSSSSNTQNSVQGGAGTTVGEISGTSGNVTVNDPALQLATVQALSDTVNNALAGGATLIGQTVASAEQQSDAQSSSDAQILANALSQESSLATYQGTGGQSYTQYIIYGLLGLAALVVVFLFSGKERA